MLEFIAEAHLADIRAANLRIALAMLLETEIGVILGTVAVSSATTVARRNARSCC